jgi:hypothetical protein
MNVNLFGMMVMVLRVLLDTGALIALAGLKGTDIVADFVGRCTKSGTVLCVTHVQVDEKVAREVHNYDVKVDRAVAELRELGLPVKIEPTEIAVRDISRYGLAKFGGEDEGRLYEKLRALISDCDRDKGKSVDDLNVARDAVTAVSALDHDAFIVCDNCLFSSFESATIDMKQLGRCLPKIVYAKPDPVDVGKAILELVRDETALNLLYDADVKKMLAYVAGGISSFTMQMTLFYFVASKALSRPLALLGILGLLLWIAVCYFLIMTGTKYFTIKQLENELGITELMWSLSSDWNRLSKLLHWVHSQAMGVRTRNYKRLALMVDIATICAILVSTGLFLSLELSLLSP